MSNLTLSVADEADRRAIYRVRHEVYARELGQHQRNDEGALTDKLDAVNVYLTAKRAGDLVGFISITPPNPLGYSIDKYFPRPALPFAVDDRLYEVRLLTVVERERRSTLAALLMYAAFRYVQAHGGERIAGIGREEILGLYARAGLEPHGLRVQSGAVTYELMSADVARTRDHLARFAEMIGRFERDLDWQIPGVPFRSEDVCTHGGAFWEAIGETFETLERKDSVISADVLDAWFDPAPAVLRVLERALAFALKTSPPTSGDGLRRIIARARGVGEEHIVPGAGSSDLIFGALRHWVSANSRVLILDPMYGEYAHVLEQLVGATVDRLTLSPENGYQVELEQLSNALSRRYDWVVLVNPNSPTGRHIPRPQLEALLADAPETTRVWIDETYVEYAGEDQSLECFAASSSNVIVVKSMSKAYALSGVRAGYLCGPAPLMAEARRSSPPWAVSLPGQIAACEALTSVDYYRARWRETAVLRGELAAGLSALGWRVVPSCTNFLLAEVPEPVADVPAFLAALRAERCYVRDMTGMSRSLGSRTVRIAVKDRHTNARMLELLAAAAGRDAASVAR